MKRTVIFALIVVAAILMALVAFSVYTGFKVVKPAIDDVNNNIARDLSKIVIIPQGIAPPMRDFNQTVYDWEMETPAKEVTAVRFSYTPSLTKSANKIMAILEMPQGGDPSIFNKVIEAIIVDEQSLAAARDPQKANLGASGKSGYNSIKLTVSPKSGQTTGITWEFEKKNLSKDLNSEYKKLGQYPDFTLKFLYGIRGFVIDLLRGN